MLCPFCAEEIKDQAWVCKHCRRDLTILRPVLERLNAVETRLAEMTEAMAALQRTAQSAAPLRHEAVAAPRLPLPLSLAIAIPLILLLTSHWLIQFTFDLNLIVLRAVSLLIPFPFGYLGHSTAPGRGFARELLIAFALAVLAVAGMTASVSLHDQVPFWPQDGREWIDAGEFTLSIALSYMTGAVLARRQTVIPSDHASELSRKVAQVIAPGKVLSRQQLESVERYVNSINSIVTALSPAAIGGISLLAGLGKFFSSN